MGGVGGGRNRTRYSSRNFQISAIVFPIDAEFSLGGSVSLNLRGIEEICQAELLSLARWLRGQGKSGEEALLVMAHEIGLRKLKTASRARLEAVLRATEM